MGQKDEIILININGTDRPGVTAALTEILAKTQTDDINTALVTGANAVVVNLVESGAIATTSL